MFKQLLHFLIALSMAATAPVAVRVKSGSSADGISVFRNPVVPDAVISGYFDHSPASGYVTFYDGYRNTSPAFGFRFSCSAPAMYDFVGCIDNVSGVDACAPERQLWYDNHHGTDYEYSANWYTGDTCDPARFAGITHPVYAPARGQVFMAGYDPNRPANGWHIRMKHDLNHNGNWDDDNLRSVYLHFTANALAVYPGQIVEEGQYLGLGGSTGYSSSPHLHFEVQRSADYFQTSYWPIDPYGWQGEGNDPWTYTNVPLWQSTIQYSNQHFIPLVMAGQEECLDCNGVQLIKNGGFEAGNVDWATQGVEIITNVNNAHLKISPYKGSWLGWLGGRNNASDSLFQGFQIPAGASIATFRYYLRVDTAETGGAFDTMTVSLRDSNGNDLRKLDQVDNTFSAPGEWVQRVVQLTNLQQWEGQTLWISFDAATDNNTITSFYIDEVSWLITATP